MNRFLRVTIIAVALVLTFHPGFAAELEPRKPDTLWTRSTDQFPGVFEFKGCAMGGNPRVLMTGTFGGDLIAFDVMTGDTLRRVKSQLGSIYNISFARNANVFSTTSPYTVKIWRWPEMDVIREFTFPEHSAAENGYVQASLTSDGRRVIIGMFNYPGSKTGLFDVGTGEVIHSFGVAPWLEPKISADDRIALVYTNNPQAYDLTTGKWLATLPSGGNGDVSMDLSEDGRYVVVGSRASYEEDGAITIYDIVEQRELKRIWLDWKKGAAGANASFVHGTSGFTHAREVNGRAYVDFHPTFFSDVTVRYELGFYGSRQSFERDVRYGAGGNTAYVSRIQLTTTKESDHDRSAAPLVSPNPSTGALKVSGLDVTDGPATWTITDVTGTQIRDGATMITGGSCQLDPGALPQGSYFLRLRRQDRLLLTHQIQR